MKENGSTQALQGKQSNNLSMQRETNGKTYVWDSYECIT
jgi:hypothetical protein